VPTSIFAILQKEEGEIEGRLKGIEGRLKKD
jgi:hypothetical protein